ncbi:hypothetical protein M9H77_17017 [Catharanthus roseus]|uniref:Uncharacterized protein n=1 Tax=Catharanthus roseus TaxID=4058 RepID=A0ACC0B3F5_CATRO|nr:hypothetical protein M9H77_17017 [Catharanthus roseus]
MARGRKRLLGDDTSPLTGTPSVEILAPPMMQAPRTPTSTGGPLPLSSTSQPTPSPVPPMTQDQRHLLALQPSLRAATTAIFQERFNGPYHTWAEIPQPKRCAWDLTHPMIRMKIVCESKAKDRLRDFLGDARGKNKRLPWIDESYWAKMWNHWNTLAYKA